MTIKPIETHYAGCRFRSRLEARWAVFFDKLGIAWEYEPQGFMIDAVLYLPDFYLPEQKLWIEVKGADPAKSDPEGYERWYAFAEKIVHFGDRAALFSGSIPTAHSLERLVDNPGNRGLKIEVFGDEGYEWCVCSSGRHFDIQHGGRNERIECGCPGFVQGGRWLPGTDRYEPVIEEAYRAARSARFEHGESG
ncbi:hypothetical protein ACQEUU_37110 [Nonomuraea sp. CA-218870]|uniref:hypothetical protein n=1 Tax=Nonomuraea sp. CA-218870 TaxID=3239998 RepID=UPI003D92C78B